MSWDGFGINPRDITDFSDLKIEKKNAIFGDLVCVTLHKDNSYVNTPLLTRLRRVLISVLGLVSVTLTISIRYSASCCGASVQSVINPIVYVLPFIKLMQLLDSCTSSFVHFRMDSVILSMFSIFLGTLMNPLSSDYIKIVTIPILALDSLLMVKHMISSRMNPTVLSFMCYIKPDVKHYKLIPLLVLLMLLFVFLSIGAMIENLGSTECVSSDSPISTISCNKCVISNCSSIPFCCVPK